MSILDKFVMLFEADASKLDKGLKDSEDKAKRTTDAIHKVDDAADKMGKTVNHTVTGFNAATDAASKIGPGLSGAITAIGGVVTAALSLQAVMANLTNAANYVDDLNDAAQRLGVALPDLAAWGDAAKLSSGTVEGLVGSLESLTASMSVIDVTGKSRIAPFLAELGIDLDNVKYKGKSALELLPDIAQAFEKLSKQQSLGIGRKLGLDAGTIAMLQTGRQATLDLVRDMRELGGVTDEQAEAAANYNDSLDLLRISWRGLWLEIGTAVLPVLASLGIALGDGVAWVRKHSDVFVGAAAAIGVALSTYALPALLSFATAAWAAVAPILLAVAPFLALGAAVGLLYEDFKVFSEGGESMIGKLVDKWPPLGSAIQAIGAVVTYVGDQVLNFGDLLTRIFTEPFAAIAEFNVRTDAAVQKLLDSFPGLRDAVGSVKLAFTSAGDAIAKAWQSVVQLVTGAISTLMSGVRNVLSTISSIGGLFGQTSVTVRQDLAAGQSSLAAAATSPVASVTSSAISNQRTINRSTTVQIDRVDVNTQATDAQGVGESIGGVLQSQMRQAVNNFDDGVAG